MAKALCRRRATACTIAAMPRLRLVVPALLAVVALSADAGITYRFTTKSNAPLQSSSGGRVWIEGDRKRVELDPNPDNPRTFDISITAKGRTTFLNLQNKTYFHEHRVSSVAAKRGGSSWLFRMPWSEDRLQGRPKITYRSAGAGSAVGDHATTTHVIHFTYRLRGEMDGISLRADVESTVSVLVAATLPRQVDPTFVRTGFTELDDELTRLLSSLEGMVVGSEVTISRKIEDGAVFTETTTTSFDELKTADVDDTLFVLPSGFKYQEPVIGIPGR
jgi:hypothetical protein